MVTAFIQSECAGKNAPDAEGLTHDDAILPSDNKGNIEDDGQYIRHDL